MLNHMDRKTNGLLIRYLIADYERSRFSINQCTFPKDAQQDMHSIPAITTSNQTNSDSSSPKLSTSLSHGSVVGIVLAAIAICATLAYGGRVGWQWRRRRRGSLQYVIHELHGDHKFEGQELDAENSATPELNGHGQPGNELHGTPKAPGELQAGIVAHEVMDKATASHELQ